MDKPSNLFLDFGLLCDSEKTEFIIRLFESDYLNPSRMQKLKEEMDKRAKLRREGEEKRQRLSDAKKREREKPENRFRELWRVRDSDPTTVKNWVKAQSNSALDQLVTHLETNTRMLNTAFGCKISDAIVMLKLELSTRPHEKRRAPEYAS